jgi:hypothetical protein
MGRNAGYALSGHKISGEIVREPQIPSELTEDRRNCK